MNLHFLWRENYVSYLWAKSVTANAYFLESGILLYDKEVLSAYATQKELRAVKKFTSHLTKNPRNILKLEKEFDTIRLKVGELKGMFSKRTLTRNTNKELYALLVCLINALNEHIRIYRYTESHYVRCIEEAVIDMLRKKIPANKNPEETLARLLARQDQNLQTQYRLTQKEEALLNLLDEISRMRFKAKKIEVPIIVSAEKVLREIAKRTCLAVNQVSNLTKEELADVLDNNAEPDLETINKRNRGFALLINADLKDNVSDLSERKKEELLRYEQDQSAVTALRGSIAYPGKVTGTARIAPLLSEPSEYRKYIRTLKKTDVLVASMTSPNLTPAFSKVAAVITDEGGLMSHAALVAREKKVPCIIGTGMATRVFHEGDTVLVDADQGVASKQNVRMISPQKL